MPILQIFYSTKSLQSTRKWSFRDGTHKQTDTHMTDKDFDLEIELAQRANSVQNIFRQSFFVVLFPLLIWGQQWDGFH